MKGLKFGLPSMKANKNDVFTEFELCYQSLKHLDLNNNFYSHDRFKNKFAECAYSYCQYYDVRSERNLTEGEMKGLLDLNKDKSIVVCKADKGNSVVILQKADYVAEIERMLSDTTKFQLLAEDPTIKREEKLIRYLRKLKNQNVITSDLYDKLRPCGSQPAGLYGLPKVHKENHPLRPICSSVNSFNYRLASELAKILSPFSMNSFTIKNTFSFVDEIQNQDSTSYYVCSFDVSSLFTSIPLDETIDIALGYVFGYKSTVHGLSKSHFKKLVEIATKETNFIFNDKCYDQVDGVAMGSPLAPILANIFMRNFEEKAFNNFTGTHPKFY